jgi:membrane dipeptidase
MLAFDCHLDLAWNALEWNRDLTLPVAEIRRREVERGYTGPGRGTGTVSLPALRDGRFAVVSATLLARHDRDWRPLGFIPKSGYESAEAANAMALGQLAYYRALERRGEARILTDWAAVESNIAEWQELPSGSLPLCGGGLGRGVSGGTPHPNSSPQRETEKDPPLRDDESYASGRPRLGVIISMEGADPILAPTDVPAWWDAGLRIISLSHYGNARYSHGTGSLGGLNEDGPALLREMERADMILDVTHLADDAMDQALGLFGGTVIASHHNCRALVNRQRQLRDSDIRKIVARGGVIGACCDAWQLDGDCGQGPGKVRRTATLETVADQIDHVCQLAGSARHSGVGSDLDGGFGTEQSPADLDTIADLPKLVGILERRGYSADEARGILFDNWVELLRRSWAKDG